MASRASSSSLNRKRKKQTEKKIHQKSRKIKELYWNLLSVNHWKKKKINN